MVEFNPLSFVLGCLFEPSKSGIRATLRLGFRALQRAIAQK